MGSFLQNNREYNILMNFYTDEDETLSEQLTRENYIKDNTKKSKLR